MSSVDAGPIPDADTSPWQDVTRETGLPGESFACLLFEDLDGDDLPDLLLSPGFPGLEDLGIVRAYRNTGAGGFVPVSIPIIRRAVALSCAAGDITGDGIVDLVIGHYPDGLTLLKGLGNLVFEDVSEWVPALAPGHPELEGIASISLFDYDADGWSDLYIGFASRPAVQSCTASADDFACYAAPGAWSPSALLHNEGGAGFSVVPAATADGTGTAVWSSKVIDWDGDGYEDLFVANDFAASDLYRNVDGTGAFVEIGSKLGITPYGHAMGASFADFDGDGLGDLYVVDLGPDQIYFRLADGSMESRSVDLGIAEWTRFASGWSPLAADFDRDGNMDLFVANSGLFASEQDLKAATFGDTSAVERIEQADFLYLGDGAGAFSLLRIPHAANTVGSITGAVAAMADYDGDGDMDIAEAHGQPYVFRLLRNNL